MKFTVNAKKLGAVVAEASQFCSPTGLDSCIDMTLAPEGNSLLIRSRTSANGYIENLEVSGDEQGRATVPAKRLSEILSTIPPEDTEFSLKDGYLIIKQKGIRFKLKSLDAGDHFSFKEPEEWNDLPEGFPAMMPKIAYAASTDSAKFVLTGIRFQHTDGKLHIVATDGRRLCLGEIDDENGTCDMTLPAPFAALVARRGAVKFAVSENLAWFRKDGRTWISTVITASYPAYARVIPEIKEESIRVETDLKAFTECVKRISLLCDTKIRKMTFSVSDGQIEVSAESEIGTARESIPCTSTADISVAMQSRYILDVLRNATGKTITMIRTGEHGPVLFLDGDSSWKGVVMPMN